MLSLTQSIVTFQRVKYSIQRPFQMSVFVSKSSKYIFSEIQKKIAIVSLANIEHWSIVAEILALEHKGQFRRLFLIFFPKIKKGEYLKYFIFSINFNYNYHFAEDSKSPKFYGTLYWRTNGTKWLLWSGNSFEPNKKKIQKNAWNRPISLTSGLKVGPFVSSIFIIFILFLAYSTVVLSVQLF